MQTARGSPPRGRGKDRPKAHAPAKLRITPAWAGKSCMHRSLPSTFQDHPRVGGEKRLKGRCIEYGLGSPPRGRGKVFLLNVGDCVTGITPAWAGKRASETPSSRRSGDHPRVGGEKEIHGKYTSFRSGSPPRGRGKAAAAACLSACSGITPAWAGKSRPAHQHPDGL